MMRFVLVILFFLLLWSVSFGIDAVELGCKIGDPNFDNGAIISQVTDTLKEELEFTGGVYYHQTTIDLSRESLRLEGGDAVTWRRKGAFNDTAAVIFVYNGPLTDSAGKQIPAVRIRANNVRLDGINVWRAFYPEPNSGGARPEGIGIEFVDVTGAKIHNCTLAAWENAVYLSPAESHNDQSSFRDIHVNSCKAFLKCDEQQSSALLFQSIFFHGPCPSGEEWVAFDMKDGGNYTINNIVLNERRLLFRFRETSSNTCTFIVDNLKLDNNSAGSRLVQMIKPGPINIWIHGHRGQHAALGTDPIILKDPSTRTFTPPPGYQICNAVLWPDGVIPIRME